MRANRTSGSVEGVLSNGHPYSDSSSGSTSNKVTAYRRNVNAARSSAANSSGCSQAAKWPPRSAKLSPRTFWIFAREFSPFTVRRTAAAQPL